MRRITLLLLVPLALGLLATGCGGGGSASAAGGGSTKLTLVAYSTPKEAYAKLIPAFQRTAAGRDVSFDQSYGSSGEQSRAVEAGLPADVVAFSLAPDITRLVDAKLVSPGWNRNRYHGMVTDSVVVIAVRKGNPKGIYTWADLAKPGVEVITPNPFTSGGARWNVMAAYGAQLRGGKTPRQGIDYLKKLFKHVVAQPSSAREALQTFAAGEGDAMIAYENEAITAQREGVDLEYVVPDQTILIENPVAVTTESKSPDKARAFVDFLRTPTAQRIFGKSGYRPVDRKVLGEFRFPTPPQLFTIADLGGWARVSDRFFDRESGVMARIEQGLGVSTESG